MRCSLTLKQNSLELHLGVESAKSISLMNVGSHFILDEFNIQTKLTRVAPTIIYNLPISTKRNPIKICLSATGR